MVGMPYPNIKSPELQEKMSYLDKHLVRAVTVLRVFNTICHSKVTGVLVIPIVSVNKSFFYFILF